MNFILAWVIFAVGFGVGLPAAFDDSSQIPSGATFKDGRAAIIEVLPGKPAEIGGLKQGDFILQVDGQTFGQADQIRDYIKNNAGKTFSFKVERGSQQLDISVVSENNPEEGPTGIALATLGKLSYPWYMAPVEGLKTAVTQIGGIFSGLYHVITSGLGFKALGGPVKIAQLTGQVADMGFIYLLQFTAFLSLNLAVLNILPFPALDGGRVLFLIIEKIRGKKNNQKIEQYANAAGFALLLLLMLLVTIKDVRGF
jgi:regulator of sigma E protease